MRSLRNSELKYVSQLKFRRVLFFDHTIAPNGVDRSSRFDGHRQLVDFRCEDEVIFRQSADGMGP